MEVELTRKNDAVHFEGTGMGNISVQIDGSPEIGGQGLGVRPMEMVLLALGSCSSLDLVSILKKQRQIINDFAVSINAERRQQIPSVFTKIHLIFKLTGILNNEKVVKATELAVKKYCSVHDMLAAGGVKITYSIVINGNDI